ncbi:MAG TPA: prolyl oligopeptidase family serine peptidase [Usitatibacter sp.]|nr:prolyl oligopeptidase family serine peptidase [Usitatibacter sp.]
MKTLIPAALLAMSTVAAAQTEDPYIWLEDVTGEKPMAWVKEQNAQSVKELEARPEFKAMHDRLVAIYNSRERIPSVQKRGKWLYNFWQDAENPRGVWRRTTMDEYRKKDPAWEPVLDIGKLSTDENEKWVFKGANCLYPDYTRCLVTLSRGGADAAEIREFDTAKKEFVKDGFVLRESKGSADWRDKDTLYIDRDFGPGTLTTSGYPRQVKEWRRGTPFESAKLVFEGKESDVGVSANVIDERGRQYELISRNITFWESEDFIRVGDKWVQLETPRDAAVSAANGRLLVRLKSDWKLAKTTYKSGSLVAFDLDGFLDGRRNGEVLYEPTERAALRSFTVTKDMLVLDILDNVKSRIVELRRKGDRWVSTNVKLPPSAIVSVGALDRDDSNDYWMTVTSFVEPTTLYLASPGSDERPKLKSLPAFFEAKGLKTQQYEATSKDGTKIPYFVVMRDGTKLDGSNPTILYGYGGFEVSMLPNYSGTIGAGWLERGGVWVLANLRGGGEFGPQWHTTALRENRQMAYDDFIAVGEDLVKRGISSPKHLGIMGGSQGGLLVGSTFVQRPDLFKAVVCQVPLLDMRRYNKLLAGASWQGEYGNPDDAKDWAFISKYSPYQNVKKDAKYPRIFFWTTTRDDRVHPGHARKMVARMKEQGHDVLYFEYTEGGHGAGSTPAQQAYLWALTYTYFINELK